MRLDLKKRQSRKETILKTLEYILLLIVLSIITLRATYIENPHVEQLQTQFFLTSEIISLILSTILLGCFVVWLLVSVLTGRLQWRRTYLGIAVALFIAAGFLAFFSASNKRMALTDLVFLVAPMAAAMLLVQLFKSKRMIRIALLLIVAIGVAATALCFDQLLDSNDSIIQDYEQNKAAYLQKANIEPDSLEHWMYEHRLYSKGIRGFLMTSNSAASFFLLAIFASLGLCIEAFRERQQPETLAAFVCYLLGSIIVLTGLVMTQSKGGIGALILGVLLLTVLSFFGKRLWKYRFSIGLFLLAGLALASVAIVMYGQDHGRLPGGNSMLVRWQYWQSAVKMIGDHIWTGVGGGNFMIFYSHYKTAAALETVMDPHNVALSMLSQYGPLGLAAFLAAFFIPVGKCLQQQLTDATEMSAVSQTADKKMWIGLLAAAVCMLAFIRPILVDAEFLMQRPDVRMAAYLVLYLFPAGVFTLAFILLCAVSTGDVSVPKHNRYLMIALVCGLAAVLVHNLIDFAIFEPGIWNTFWLLIAIIVACIHDNAAIEEKPISFQGLRRLFVIMGLAAVSFGYVVLVVVPPMKANGLFRGFLRSEERSFGSLENAIATDPLSPDTAYNAAGVLAQMYAQQRPSAKDPLLLEKAIEYAGVSHRRNPVDFKPFRIQGDIYLLLGSSAKSSEQKNDYLQKAYIAFHSAIIRYPGSDRMHYTLGMIAEELQQPQEALSHFQNAVEIEEAYRSQFQVMYPDRKPVVSRMGHTAYTTAKVKIEELQKQLNGADKTPQQNEAGD